jgi:hypothetical protein
MVPAIIFLEAKAMLMMMMMTMITRFRLRISKNFHVDVTDNKDLTSVEAVLISTPV